MNAVDMLVIIIAFLSIGFINIWYVSDMLCLIGTGTAMLYFIVKCYSLENYKLKSDKKSI